MCVSNIRGTFSVQPSGCVRFKLLTAVITKNTVFWEVTPCGLCKKDVSEERIAFIIRQIQFLVAANVPSPLILSTLMLEETRSF
jgi:hypothetical protein